MDFGKIDRRPNKIVSYPDMKFTGKCCKSLCKSSRKSIAFPLQTNSNTERVKQTQQAYLSNFVNYYQQDSHQYLPIAEFAYNNTEVETTKLIPFFEYYGFQ